MKLAKPIAINIAFLLGSLLGLTLGQSNIALTIMMILLVAIGVIVKWRLSEIFLSLLIFIMLRVGICFFDGAHLLHMGKMCEAPQFTIISGGIFIIPLALGAFLRKLIYKNN